MDSEAVKCAPAAIRRTLVVGTTDSNDRIKHFSDNGVGLDSEVLAQIIRLLRLRFELTALARDRGLVRKFQLITFIGKQLSAVDVADGNRTALFACPAGTRKPS